MLVIYSMIDTYHIHTGMLHLIVQEQGPCRVEIPGTSKIPFDKEEYYYNRPLGLHLDNVSLLTSRKVNKREQANLSKGWMQDFRRAQVKW